ncbi:hypothetical protein HQ81_0013 [Dickeya phage phiDP23.1]|uniref:Uncharacterized protein n=5 Tax=Aglimvirinae TaxID=2169530 RepID=A0A7L4YE33_9CAUD|nr:hypothetical protein HQ80_0036 [Dickeya phage phiD3]AIM51888.1 hypothetical protein HQ81_0013 [Dickeya phage phiDP23.1]ASD51222.1 hypothetical protein [Dickeya phage JA15]QHB41743.1 hypothetical protein [Dickeya phage Ds9CZ]QHB42774.1 hypothetical protein [Dickeya phage Ds3CZ]
MLQDDYLADLVKAAKLVCHTKQYIELDTTETLSFFALRKSWAENGIDMICQEGKLVQLDPLPVRTNTLEWYVTKDGVEIIPKFQYHSIVNFFLCRRGTNLIPKGNRS